MNAVERAGRMALTYSTGAFASTVDAGGDAGFMNLGFAPDLRRPGSTVQRQRCLARLVLDAIGPAAGQTLLDVGCGKGGMANLIGRLIPEARVVGVNIDYHQLVTAWRHRDAGVEFVTAEAERLPFGAAAFDTIYAVEVLSHIIDKKAFVDELTRVLRSGGRVVLAVIALARPYRSFGPDEQAHLVRVADLFAERPEDIPTLAGLRELLAAAGLRVAESRDLSGGVFGPRHDAFVRMHRWLRHRNPLFRAGFAAVVAVRWRLRRREFAEFLAVNTAMHPNRLYEYHLLTLVNDAKEAARA
jgi:SAM-dependent methyltransferase